MKLWCCLKIPPARVVSSLFFHFNLPIPCTVSPDASNVFWIRPGSHWFLLDSDGASANGFAAVDGLGGVFPLYLDCFEFDFKVQLGANTNNHVGVCNSLGWMEITCGAGLSFNNLWMKWIPALPSQWTTSSIRLQPKF